MPATVRRNGSSSESVDTAYKVSAVFIRLVFSAHTFSGFPLKPTRVPFRVYRFCDADTEAERSEDGPPRTSN